MTRPQTIRLETLADGPGLLPYKLGSARLTTHYHSFIQFIQLTDIEDQIKSVQTQVETFKTKLSSGAYTIYEHQIDYLTNKIYKVLNRIKSLEPVRVKRGLIDGLGSVIKSVTGNLDYQDAVRYNEAIRNLQENDNKLVSEFNNHITLCKEWMAQHNTVLEQLASNQVKINASLQLLLEKDALRDYNLVRFTKFAQVLGIITNNVEDIMLEVIRIEDILAFIHASSTHHSMIDIEVLKSMIEKLRSFYNQDEIINLELREYYDLIKPGSYFAEKRIVIVYNFPIVSHEIYDLYKLSIVPNENQLALVPPTPYIATNEKSFVYIEAECPKYSSIYLCEEQISHQLRTEPDCIQDLIVNQNLKNTCRFTRISLSNIAVGKLDDQHYAMYLPEPTKVQLTCERKDFNTLQGSYLVTIPKDCYMRTTEFTIINENNEIRGQPLKLSKIPYNQINQTDIQIITNAGSTSVNLEDLHSIQSKIMLEKPIQMGKTESFAVYHTTIPFYSFILSAAAVTSFLLFRKYKRRQHMPISKPEDIKKQHVSKTHSYEEIDLDIKKQNEHPATFSLNLTK